MVLSAAVSWSRRGSSGELRCSTGRRPARALLYRVRDIRLAMGGPRSLVRVPRDRSPTPPSTCAGYRSCSGSTHPRSRAVTGVVRGGGMSQYPRDQRALLGRIALCYCLLVIAHPLPMERYLVPLVPIAALVVDGRKRRGQNVPGQMANGVRTGRHPALSRRCWQGISRGCTTARPHAPTARSGTSAVGPHSHGPVSRRCSPG